ncbi:transporter [Lithospermum erythrorhizon]|uniref:Protein DETOXIFICATION n=1 Tax=Lithospermum erythrorhizon TaxID=34254 RepID=A0AAV3RH34_LITER
MEEEPLLEKQYRPRVATWEAFKEELKMTCSLALPMVIMTVSQYMSRFVSMMMVGHLGELALSGCSVATALTNVLGFSLVCGMSSGLETLCGQAFGAKQYHKLGIYTYGATISVLVACIPVCILWIFLEDVLIFLGQDPMISREAGRFAIWLIPALFPYAIIQPLTRYLQMQSLIIVMVLCSVAALIFQIPVCWIFVFKFELGTAGAALSIGLSYWVNVILLVLYVKYSSACEKTRITFSSDVFPTIPKFMKLAIPSALMLCLEWWIFEVMVLLSGLLSNPQLETSVLSICLLICSVHYFLPFSVGTAASIRVSNELGAGNPERARMIVVAVIFLAVAETTISVILLFCFRHILGFAFSDSDEVVNYLSHLMPFICLLLLTDCFQAVLSGVARGSGWQHIGAYINFGSYYIVALPVAATLGFGIHLGGTGLWLGLNAGSAVQSTLLSLITGFTDWRKQASMAKERVLAGGTLSL